MASGTFSPSISASYPRGDTGPPQPQNLGHIPALDGVRGLAILAVMIYRFGLRGDFHSTSGEDEFPQLVFQTLLLGQRGVDLFFVLSGFLITGILFDARGEPHFFRHFYTRRILRILPLYYGSLVLFLLVIPRFLSSAQFPINHAMEDQHWLWLHAANFSHLLRGDWSLGRLDHFWSLAIEEHFYFIWPLVIFLCTRKSALWICGVGIVGTMIARIAWLKAGGGDVAVETLTIFRIDGLLTGAWLALAVRGSDGAAAVAKPASWVFVATAILLVPLVLTGKRLMMIPETIFAVFFTSVLAIILGGDSHAWYKKLCETSFLRFFGKYSYAMYIFQNPLIPLTALLFTSKEFESLTGSFVAGRLLYGLLMAAITTAVSLLSWNLFEKHFLSLKDVLAPKTRPA